MQVSRGQSDTCLWQHDLGKVWLRVRQMVVNEGFWGTQNPQTGQMVMLRHQWQSTGKGMWLQGLGVGHGVQGSEQGQYMQDPAWQVHRQAGGSWGRTVCRQAERGLGEGMAQFTLMWDMQVDGFKSCQGQAQDQGFRVMPGTLANLIVLTYQSKALAVTSSLSAAQQDWGSGS